MRASVGLVAGLLACRVSVCARGTGSRGKSYSCSKASPKRSTPLQVHVSRTSMISSFRIARGYATQEPLHKAPSHDGSSRQRPTAAPASANAPGCLTSIVSNISALEARTTRERRHDVGSFDCLEMT